MKKPCYINAKDYFESLAAQKELVEVLKESRATILKSHVKMPDYWHDSAGHTNQMGLVEKIDALLQNLS